MKKRQGPASPSQPMEGISSANTLSLVFQPQNLEWTRSCCLRPPVPVLSFGTSSKPTGALSLSIASQGGCPWPGPGTAIVHTQSIHPLRAPEGLGWRPTGGGSQTLRNLCWSSCWWLLLFSGKVRIGVSGQAGPLLDYNGVNQGSETTPAAPSDKLTQAGGDPSALTLGTSRDGNRADFRTLAPVPFSYKCRSLVAGSHTKVTFKNLKCLPF